MRDIYFSTGETIIDTEDIMSHCKQMFTQMRTYGAWELGNRKEKRGGRCGKAEGEEVRQLLKSFVYPLRYVMLSFVENHSHNFCAGFFHFLFRPDRHLLPGLV
jgi:hypothetical protein